MKMKIFKLAVMLMSVCIMFVVCVSPVSAYDNKEQMRGVSNAYTENYYIYQQLCYGVVTIYPFQGSASTYCQDSSAGKQVYVDFLYFDSNFNIRRKDNDEKYDWSGNTFHGEGSTLLNVNTGNAPSDLYMARDAYSYHKVKVTYITWDSFVCEDIPRAYY